MISSCNRLLFTGLILSCAVLCHTATVLANPRPLIDMPGETADPPQEITEPGAIPDQQKTPGFPAPAGAATEGASAGILVSDPGRVTLDTIGLMTAGEGGIPGNFWQGTGYDAAVRRVNAVRGYSGSSTVDALLKRLLISAGPAPEDAAGEVRLLDARIHALRRLGAEREALALLAMIPQDHRTVEHRRTQLDILFFSQQFKEACALAHAAMESFDAFYFQKAMVFCQAHRGKLEAARLGLALLQERGLDENAAFARLIARMTGDAATEAVPVPRTFRGLEFALYVSAREPVPEAILARSSVLVMRALAHTTAMQQPPEVRLAAAERAFGAGAVTVTHMRQLYREITPPETKPPAAQSGNDDADSAQAAPGDYAPPENGAPDPWHRVRLWHAARAATDYARRAALLLETLTAMRASPIGHRAEALLAEELLALPVVRRDGFEALARAACDAAMRQGKETLAWRWLHTLYPGLDATTREFLEKALEMAQYRQFESRDAGRMFFYDYGALAPPATRQAVRLLAVLRGLGHTVPDGLQVFTAAHDTPGVGQVCPADDELQALDIAAQEQRTAEAILRVAEITGRAPLQALCAPAIGHMIAALVGVGLESEAQQLSAEVVERFPL